MTKEVSLSLSPSDVDNFLTTNADDKIFTNSDGIEFALSAVEPFDYVYTRYTSGTGDSVTNTVPLILLGGSISAAERAKFEAFQTAFNAFKSTLTSASDADLDAGGLALKAILMFTSDLNIFAGVSSTGAVDIAYPLRVANITESGSRRDALFFFYSRLISVDGATATGALYTAINNVIDTDNATTRIALTTAFDDGFLNTSEELFLLVFGDLNPIEISSFFLLTSQ